MVEKRKPGNPRRGNSGVYITPMVSKESKAWLDAQKRDKGLSQGKAIEMLIFEYNNTREK